MFRAGIWSQFGHHEKGTSATNRDPYPLQTKDSDSRQPLGATLLLGSQPPGSPHPMFHTGGCVPGSACHPDLLSAVCTDAAVYAQGWTPPFLCLSHLLSTCAPPRHPLTGSSRGHQPECSSYPKPSLRADGSNILPHLCPTCDMLALRRKQKKIK